MRSLSDESGAVAVMVAGLMVVLIGFAALAIDVSSLYQERRTLQNGADAGALAVAKDCAKTTCVPSKANTFANSNADDGASTVDEVCGTGSGLPACASAPTVPSGTKYVKVTTSTNEPGGATPNQINFKFAPVLDLVDPGNSAQHRGQTIQASAVAAWGSPGGATVLPLTFSLCEYNKAVPTPGSLQTVPPIPSTAPQLIFFHNTTDAGSCGAGPSGADLPGGFGDLQETGCQVELTADSWVNDDTGRSSDACLSAALVGTVVLIPVYDNFTGTGSNGSYHIRGFAALYLTGYKIKNTKVPNNMKCPGTSGNSGDCIEGYFTKFVTTGTVLGGPDMGVTITKLVG